VTRVILTPRAVADLRELIELLGLPPDAMRRSQRSLRMLERFPLAGRALTGRWQGTRFIIGPWPWLVLVYVLDSAENLMFVLAAHDARSSSAATGT